MVAHFIKLTILGFLLVLTCGRIGLILHELCGHALPAYLSGGEVIDYKLTYFGGGWVRFLLPNQHNFVVEMLVYSGGIIIELIAALFCFTLLKYSREPSFRFYTLVLGSILIIHGFWYFSHTFHLGHSDGDFFYRNLNGSSREVFSIVLSLMTIIVTYGCSQKYSNIIHCLTSSKHKWKSLGLFLFSMSIASVIHFGLTKLEGSLKVDVVQEQIFTPKYVIESEVMAERKRDSLGRDLTNKEIQAVIEEAKPIPLNMITMIGMGLAAMIGFIRQRDYKIEGLSLERIKLVHYIILAIALMPLIFIISATN